MYAKLSATTQAANTSQRTRPGLRPGTDMTSVASSKVWDVAAGTLSAALPVLPWTWARRGPVTVALRAATGKGVDSGLSV